MKIDAAVFLFLTNSQPLLLSRKKFCGTRFAQPRFEKYFQKAEETSNENDKDDSRRGNGIIC